MNTSKRFLKVVFKRETFTPILALVFATSASVGLILARIVWTNNINYAFLIWNLFLAWIPLIIALFASDSFQNGERRISRLAGMAGAWLLFFPNAPYICTDLIHLTNKFYRHFWIDLTLILLCAFTGLVLGFVSLYLMQSLVIRMFGRAAGWLFVGGSACLCSFGIYLGRFLRFNSWDVLLRPDKIYRGIDNWMDTQVPGVSSGGFLILFTAFLFVAYVMLYALTHLPKLHQSAIPLTAVVSETEPCHG